MFSFLARGKTAVRNSQLRKDRTRIGAMKKFSKVHTNHLISQFILASNCPMNSFFRAPLLLAALWVVWAKWCIRLQLFFWNAHIWPIELAMCTFCHQVHRAHLRSKGKQEFWHYHTHAGVETRRCWLCKIITIGGAMMPLRNPSSLSEARHASITC